MRFYNLIFMSVLVLGCNTDINNNTNLDESSDNGISPFQSKEEKTNKEIDSSETTNDATSGFRFKQEKINFYTKVLTLNDKLSMDLPNLLLEASKEDLVVKYGNQPKPTECYLSDDKTVCVSFNKTSNSVLESQLITLIPLFQKQFENTYPGIKWYKNELITIDSKKVIFLEFETSKAFGNIFQIIAVTSFENKMLTISFSCPKSMRKVWRKNGNRIIKSLEFNRK